MWPFPTDVLSQSPRGGDVSQPLLIQYYQLLPHHVSQDGSHEWSADFEKGLAKFQRAVEARYFESSLEKLLIHADAEVRQAAVLALGLIGSYRVNESVARRLHDDDPVVWGFAETALWNIWFRADSAENNEELRRLSSMVPTQESAHEILVGFEKLIKKSPRFAEAYNQRAIVYFKLGEFQKAVHDCQRVLRLNHYHFGAASGMAQCFMKQRKLRAALRVYRQANRINPHLDGVRNAIESLERTLGEEGKR